MKNILDKLGFHEKWHLSTSDRRRCLYSINEPIIDYIFEKIKIDNGFFVEFGAWDGIHLSNCRKLYNDGWSGMFIENDSNKFKQLKKNYEHDEKIITINSFVDTDENRLDIILNNKLNNVDFCSIDIDGLDLNIFNAIEDIFPTVVCIEGGQVLFPNEKLKIDTKIQSENVTQSLYNYINDFEEKGYKILCAYQDIFFIKEEFYNLFNVSSNINEIYITGLFALPRIPWLYEKKQQYNIKNDILDYIISNTDNTNIRNRNRWVKDNYNKFEDIKKTLISDYV